MTLLSTGSVSMDTIYILKQCRTVERNRYLVFVDRSERLQSPFLKRSTYDFITGIMLVHTWM